MSHFIEIDGVREKIYQLIDIALSAEKFVEKYGVGVLNANGISSKQRYLRRTKLIISNNCLEVSVKLRNAFDLLGLKYKDINADKLINICDSGPMANGIVYKKDFVFVCHKIIHAKYFLIDEVGSCEKNDELKWWGGMVTISGIGKDEKEWCLFFSVLEWCDSILLFVDEIEDKLKAIQMKSRDLN